MVKDMEVYFDMTMRQKAVFECLRAPHAQDFLLAVPIDGLGQHMSLVKYLAILKYRLMIPLFSVDAICLVCRKACLDSFGEHAIHCKELLGFKYRHDLVRDVLFDICKRAGISAMKEAPVNFLTDPSGGRSKVRPADGFYSGLKAASSKVTKHEKACIENQHVFIPFAFDTFGFLAPEAVELLSRVQRVMHSNVMTPRSRDVVFKRIGFAIQKGLAGQLVARLPSTTIVAKPSVVDPNVEDKGENFVQSCCGHFFVRPAVDCVQVFKISGPKFLKLNRGTWHAGPLFESHAMDFYNLELSNTNVSSSTECLTSTGSIVLWDATLLILF
ncbi:putative reverse transcriptase domain-containing protein [Tanacetum coccineum]